MALKLYGFPMSTCTARVLTCLYEKAAEFEFVPVNRAAGEHKQPPFLAKNPFGKVPALDDGDLTLFESRAITKYVASKYKEQGADLLRMHNGVEAALVDVWLEVESQHYNPPIQAIVYETLIVQYLGGTPNDEIVKTNVKKLGKVLDVYEERLSNCKYLAGDFFSLADLHHLSYTYYMMKTPNAELVNSRPHVKKWWEDISSRPAFKKVAGGMAF